MTRPEGKSKPFIPACDSKRKRGSEHHLSKLDDDKVALIRRDSQAGKSVSEIASQFGVNYGTVYWIVKGKTWKHVKF